MSRATQPDLPALCRQEALDCHSCTSSTAKEVARACPGMPRKLITRLFVQIHTYPACSRMHANFARAYLEAGETGAAPEIKKPIGVCQPIAATAAA